MKTLWILLLCFVLPGVVFSRMARLVNPADLVSESDPLNPNRGPTQPPKPMIMGPQPNQGPNPMLPRPQPRPQGQQQQQPQGPQSGRPMSPQNEVRRQLGRPQTSARQVAQPMPQRQVQGQGNGQMQGVPMPMPQQRPQQPSAVQMPALLMLMPDARGFPVMLPENHATAMGPRPPQMLPVAPAQNPGQANQKEGPKSGDLTDGFNPWAMGLEQLEALVRQFREKGSIVLPNGQTIHKVTPGQTAGQHMTPTSGSKIDPAAGHMQPQQLVPGNGQPGRVNGPQQPMPNPGPKPAQLNEVPTEDPSKQQMPDNQMPVTGAGNATAASTAEQNRRRSLKQNPLDHQHNTIETRFSQSPAKVNMGAVCESKASQQAPSCMAEHKWEEIMRQEIDCGPQRKREWRCYCGFFEEESLPPMPSVRPAHPPPGNPTQTP